TVSGDGRDVIPGGGRFRGNYWVYGQVRKDLQGDRAPTGQGRTGALPATVLDETLQKLLVERGRVPSQLHSGLGCLLGRLGEPDDPLVDLWFRIAVGGQARQIEVGPRGEHSADRDQRGRPAVDPRPAGRAHRPGKFRPAGHGGRAGPRPKAATAAPRTTPRTLLNVKYGVGNLTLEDIKLIFVMWSPCTWATTIHRSTNWSDVCAPRRPARPPTTPSSSAAFARANPGTPNTGLEYRYGCADRIIGTIRPGTPPSEAPP